MIKRPAEKIDALALPGNFTQDEMMILLDYETEKIKKDAIPKSLADRYDKTSDVRYNRLRANKSDEWLELVSKDFGGLTQV